MASENVQCVICNQEQSRDDCVGVNCGTEKNVCYGCITLLNTFADSEKMNQYEFVDTGFTVEELLSVPDKEENETCLSSERNLS